MLTHTFAFASSVRNGVIARIVYCSRLPAAL